MSFGRVLAAAVSQPRRWPVEIVRTGRDLNGKMRSEASLRRAIAAFEGRPLKVLELVTADGRRINDHQQIDKLVGFETMNVVGHVENVRYDSRAFAGLGGLVGDAVLIEGDKVAEDLETKLQGLRASGGLAKGAVGLSFNGYGEVGPGNTEEISAVDSVDVVTHPAAYGRISHRVAASIRSAPMKDLVAYLTRLCAALVADIPANVATNFALAKHMVARLKASTDLSASAATALGLSADDLTKEPLETLMGYLDVKGPELATQRAKASADEEAARLAAAGGKTGDDGVDPEVLESRRRAKASADEIEILATEQRLRAACVEKNLPAKTVTRLLASYKGRILSVDQAAQVAKDKADEIDSLRTDDVGNRVVVVAEKRDRLTASLAHMLSKRCPKPEGLDPDTLFMGSLHKFARDGFGLDLAEAARGDSDRRRLKASIDGTSFDAVFADALGRSMLAEYRGDPNLTQGWRNLVNIVSERDFRTKRVLAATYYGDMPTVAEGAPYLPLTTPTDKEETYALAKVGGTEDITWEKVLNDDLGLFATMVKRIGMANRETIAEAVFYQIRIATQKTMVDTFKLTSASRSPANLLTAALSGDATGWANYILAVQQMQAATGGGGVAKGVSPKFVVIPVALAKAFGVLFSDFSAAAADIPSRRGLEVLGAAMPMPVIDRRATNTTDWFTVADPADAEVFRVAFLGGRQEPEIIIANNETFGSMFTNDKIVVKSRFPFVVGVVDTVGIQGNDVA